MLEGGEQGRDSLFLLCFPKNENKAIQGLWATAWLALYLPAPLPTSSLLFKRECQNAHQILQPFTLCPLSKHSFIQFLNVHSFNIISLSIYYGSEGRFWFLFYQKPETYLHLSPPSPYSLGTTGLLKTFSYSGVLFYSQRTLEADPFGRWSRALSGSQTVCVWRLPFYIRFQRLAGKSVREIASKEGLEASQITLMKNLHFSDSISPSRFVLEGNCPFSPGEILHLWFSWKKVSDARLSEKNWD